MQNYGDGKLIMAHAQNRGIHSDRGTVIFLRQTSAIWKSWRNSMAVGLAALKDKMQT